MSLAARCIAAIATGVVAADLPGKARAHVERRASAKRRPVKPMKRERLAKEAGEAKAKSARRRDVRALCAARAGDRCEACREWTPAERLHMDHFWGRAREESVESCWMLCPPCDSDKTENRPSRGAWLGGFSLHCERMGYAAQLRKVDSAIALDRAQHQGRP